jgi:predicted site-specific integrase-resolvase
MAFIIEKEAATMAMCSPPTLREKVKSGAWNIKYNTRAGRQYRYNDADIKKLIGNPEAVITGMMDRWQQRRAQKREQQLR